MSRHTGSLGVDLVDILRLRLAEAAARNTLTLIGNERQRRTGTQHRRSRVRDDWRRRAGASIQLHRGSKAGSGNPDATKSSRQTRCTTGTMPHQPCRLPVRGLTGCVASGGIVQHPLCLIRGLIRPYGTPGAFERHTLWGGGAGTLNFRPCAARGHRVRSPTAETLKVQTQATLPEKPANRAESGGLTQNRGSGKFGLQGPCGPWTSLSAIGLGRPNPSISCWKTA